MITKSHSTSSNFLCPRVESNHDLLLRRELFYPLNYGDVTRAGHDLLYSISFSLIFQETDCAWEDQRPNFSCARRGARESAEPL